MPNRKTMDLFISDKLRNILEYFKDQSLVSQLLCSKRIDLDFLVDNPVNYLSISETDNRKISYLSKDRIKFIKEKVEEDFWTSSRRFHNKPGSFVNKILKNSPAAEIEKFSNFYTSFITKDNFKFEIVTGETIRDFYLQDSYTTQKGTLGSSCMKYDVCGKFLNMYVENTNIFSMLIMKSNSQKGIFGRALLWNLGDLKIMDRIYTIQDSEYSHIFKKWATDNGYLYKSFQNWSNTLHFENLSTQSKIVELDVNLNIWEYKYYPYLDTFKWLDMNDGKLFNYKPSYFDHTNSKHRVLTFANGMYERSDYLMLDYFKNNWCYRGEMTALTYRNENIWTNINNCKWSDTIESYIYEEDSIYDE